MKQLVFVITTLSVLFLSACGGSGAITQPAAAEPTATALTTVSTATLEPELSKQTDQEVPVFEVPTWKVKAVEDLVVPNLKFKAIPHGQAQFFGPSEFNMFVSNGVNITHSILYIKIQKDGCWQMNMQMTTQTLPQFKVGQENIDWSVQTMKVKVDNTFIYIRFREGQWLAVW